MCQDDPRPDDSIELEVGDVLDLHSFPPSEIGDLVRHYLDLAIEHRFHRVRLIHGRGRGVQRRTVRTLLSRHPRVLAYGDAPLEAGGWGATWVELISDVQ